MSLFNPINTQFENLQRALDDRKTVSLSEAARAMKVKPEKVDHSLMLMGKRGLFGKNAPYLDDELRMVVIDKKYAGYAAVMSAVEYAIGSLTKAQQLPHRAAVQPAGKSNAGQNHPVGGFFRDLADNYVSGSSGAESFKKAARSFLSGDETRKTESTVDTQDAEETLTELLQCAHELRSMLLAYPDRAYDRQLAEFLNAVSNTAETWAGCYEAAAAKQVKGPAMVRTEEKLRYQLLADFNRKLQELKEPVMDAKNPKSPAMKDVEKCIGDMKLLRMKLNNYEMQLAIDRIQDILRQIRTALQDDAIPLNRSAINSLRSCYLPMIKQLTGQYIKYQGIQQPGTATVKAMNETQRVLGMDVPLALQRLLSDMRTGAAINMEAQATALKQKLQMDGLLG